MSAYTKAALFQPGADTDLLIRFSTVAGERGKIEQEVRAKQDEKDPKAAGHTNPARSSMLAKA